MKLFEYKIHLNLNVIEDIKRLVDKAPQGTNEEKLAWCMKTCKGAHNPELVREVIREKRND